MVDLYPLAAPLLRALKPEFAHSLTIWALKSGLGARAAPPDPPSLALSVLGRTFPNPVGMAAGFDKSAQVADAILAMGFGFAEVGTVTPKPQAGNPKPRLFRLSQDHALINRLGFNNDGLEVVAGRLDARRGRSGIVGVNIGANRDSADRVADYVMGFERFAGLADYVTINVSSPNTPGLRALQDKSALDDLVERLMAARPGSDNAHRTPLLLKIAPDLDDQALDDIAEIVLARHIDGVIISNTTIGGRDRLRSRHGHEQGGLSGTPLFQISTQILRRFHQITEGRVLLIGVGGIGSGADAYEKIRSGASLVQLYSALTYQGPGLIKRIKQDLAACLARDGFSHVAEAVGTGVER